MRLIRCLNLKVLLVLLFFGWNHASSQEVDTAAHNTQPGERNKGNKLQAEELNRFLVLESQDRKYKIWFEAQMQADGAVFMGRTYNPIGNGVAVRRARFAVKSQFAEKWYGEILIDIANSELELKDAYLQFSSNSHWVIQVGNFKEGFSLESVTSSRNLTFIERANVISAFAPSRHLGLAAHFSKNWIFLMGGVHFQDIGTLESRTFSKVNNQTYGFDEGVSFTGRWVIIPFFNDSKKGFHLGLAGSYRTPKSDAEIPGSIHYSTRSLTAINRKKYMDTDIIADVDYVGLGGLELAAYYKSFRFQSEYVLTNVHRKNAHPQEQFDGWYAFGSVMLFGGNYKYSSSQARFTQPARGKEWGDIELAFRYDYLSMNSRGDGIIKGGAGQGYTFGVNYLVNSNVKIMLNCAYLIHDRYANGKGKLFVGYNEWGELTKDPNQLVDVRNRAGEDYSMISLRFEVDF